MDLADHLRQLKAELRRHVGPFCDQCHAVLTDDEVDGLGNQCESCERALVARYARLYPVNPDDQLK
jgi:hypothetical protein